MSQPTSKRSRSKDNGETSPKTELSDNKQQIKGESTVAGPTLYIHETQSDSDTYLIKVPFKNINRSILNHFYEFYVVNNDPEAAVETKKVMDMFFPLEKNKENDIIIKDQPSVETKLNQQESSKKRRVSKKSDLQKLEEKFWAVSRLIRNWKNSVFGDEGEDGDGDGNDNDDIVVHTDGIEVKSGSYCIYGDGPFIILNFFNHF